MFAIPMIYRLEQLKVLFTQRETHHFFPDFSPRKPGLYPITLGKYGVRNEGYSPSLGYDRQSDKESFCCILLLGCLITLFLQSDRRLPASIKQKTI